MASISIYTALHKQRREKMRFPHAAKGVSKLFTAEILLLIASLVTVVSTVFAVLASSTNNEDTATGFALMMLALIIPAGVILIVGAILNIIGYFQAARDEDAFSKAIIFTVANLILSSASNFFVNQTGFLGWLSTAFNVLGQIASLLSFVFTIFGLMNLSEKCNRPDMVDRGSFILKELVIVYIVTFIVNFITRYFRENAFNNFIVYVLTAFAAVTTVVIYILQIVYLAKAKKMLKEH